MHPLRVVLQVVGETFEAVKRDIVIRVDAEFDGGFMGCPAVSAVPPFHQEVLTLDRCDLFGLLDDKAPVEPASQVREIQRVYTAPLYFHRSQFQAFPLPLGIKECGDGTGNEEKTEDRQPLG